MPVNIGPLEIAIIQALPLLCGGSILIALVVIIALMARSRQRVTLVRRRKIPDFRNRRHVIESLH